MKKLFKLTVLLSLLLLAAGVLSASGQSLEYRVLEQKVDSVLSKMTLKEKLGQLIVIHNGHPHFEEYVKKGWIGNTNGLHPGADAMAKNRQMQEWAIQSRLGIPMTFSADVIHGYRTIYPMPLALSCSWDPVFIEQLDRMAAREATTEGINWDFSPMVDVSRDPRWGRIAESGGEDPWLNSIIARAEVLGFQGSGLADSTTMVATAKHFVGYGAAEAGRDYNTVDMSERRLREVYLPPFQAAVDAGAGAVMAGFHSYNRIPTSANHWLLTQVLRDELGFKGVLISDYDAITQLENHGVAAGDKEADALAFHAGIDVDLHSGSYFEQLPLLLKEGKVTQQEIDERVRRVLELKFKLGLFTDPFRYFSKKRAGNELISTEHREMARRAARESMVLLKNNDSLLPFGSSIKKIALVGPLGDSHTDLLGPVHAMGRAEETVSILEGLQSTGGDNRQVTFARGSGILQPAAAGAIRKAVEQAEKADVIVATVGEAGDMSGEAASRSRVRVPDPQLKLLKALRETGKPLVVVLINGRPLALPWVAEYADAILEAWLPGTEGGHAVADLLFGRFNPSGKLTTSFPRNEGQLPLYYNALPTGRPATDDKWTSKYLDVPNTARYPFGYGLSYTRFKYSNVELDRPAISVQDTLHASVTVTNAGSRAGDEIVQLYLNDPVAAVSRPVKELKGFRKIHLRPGESRRISFDITGDDLRFIGPDMKSMVEAGTFKVMIGPSSMEYRSKTFILKK